MFQNFSYFLTIRTSPPPRMRGIASAWTSVGRLKKKNKGKGCGQWEGSVRGWCQCTCRHHIIMDGKFQWNTYSQSISSIACMTSGITPSSADSMHSTRGCGLIGGHMNGIMQIIISREISTKYRVLFMPAGFIITQHQLTWKSSHFAAMHCSLLDHSSRSVDLNSDSQLTTTYQRITYFDSHSDMEWRSVRSAPQSCARTYNSWESIPLIGSS